MDYDFSNPLTHIYYPNQKQNFEFASTVSWTFKNPQKLVVYPPKPRLLFKVPSDFFYPFQIESSAGYRAGIFNQSMFLLPLLSFTIMLCKFL